MPTSHRLRRRMGRPTRLTSEVFDKIIATLRAGNHRHVAASYAGVGLSTFMEWMERGTRGGRRGRNALYAEFAEAVPRAEAEAHVRCVTLISAAAQKSWQAAAWWVSRKYPEVWGQKDLHDVQRTDARPFSDVSDQEIEAELERLRLLQQAATVTTSHRVPRRTSGNGSAPPIIDVTPTPGNGHGQP